MSDLADPKGCFADHKGCYGDADEALCEAQVLSTDGRTGEHIDGGLKQGMQTAPSVHVLEWNLTNLDAFVQRPDNSTLTSPPWRVGPHTFIVRFSLVRFTNGHLYATATIYVAPMDEPVQAHGADDAEGPERRATTAFLTQGATKFASPINVPGGGVPAPDGGWYSFCLRLQKPADLVAGHASTTSSENFFLHPGIHVDLGYIHQIYTSGVVSERNGGSVTLVFAGLFSAPRDRSSASRNRVGGVAHQLGSLLRTPRFCDVVLAFSDGTRQPAHRAILAVRSPVFATMFNSSFTEAKSDAVVSVDVKPRVGEALLDFIYTASIQRAQLLPDWELAVQLYEAADYYELHELASAAVHIIAKFLQPANILQSFALAQRHTDQKQQKDETGPVEKSPQVKAVEPRPICAAKNNTSGEVLLGLVHRYFARHYDSIMEHMLSEATRSDSTNVSEGGQKMLETMMTLFRLKSDGLKLDSSGISPRVNTANVRNAMPTAMPIVPPLPPMPSDLMGCRGAVIAPFRARCGTSISRRKNHSRSRSRSRYCDDDCCSDSHNENDSDHEDDRDCDRDRATVGFCQRMFEWVFCCRRGNSLLSHKRVTKLIKHRKRPSREPALDDLY